MARISLVGMRFTEAVIMNSSVLVRSLSCLFLCLVVTSVRAEGVSVAYGPATPRQAVASNEAVVGNEAAASNEVYTFSSPPREKSAAGEDFYQPIADLLSKATGKKFIYRYPDNWLAYQADMRKGAYDVIFDGPHFVGWRIQQMGHTPLLKLPQPHVWVVITKQGSRFTAVKELAGRGVCVHAPPNFGTLTLLSLFDNPVRQPHMIEIKGWDSAYKGVVDGKCEATILPATNLKKLDPEMKFSKIIHQHQPYPNQAFTLGPRITPAMHAQILKAMQSEEGKMATKGLREKFCKGENLVAATKEEYADVSQVLKTYWGFEF
jgi:ABC-type phosphate/phosphonate transport system substrate-binding protein